MRHESNRFFNRRVSREADMLLFLAQAATIIIAAKRVGIEDDVRRILPD